MDAGRAVEVDGSRRDGCSNGNGVEATADGNLQVQQGDTELDTTGNPAAAVLPRRPVGQVYGHDTELAVRNWDGLTNLLPAQVYPAVISGIGICKVAAADANFELGGFRGLRFTPDGPEIPAEEVHAAIVSACREMIAGKLNKEMVVDVLQGGAGTSLHMNANEVLAHRANEILAQRTKGIFMEGLEVATDYSSFECPIHPNDTINDGQSTNDVIPTAARIGVLLERRGLIQAMKLIEESFRARAAQIEFATTPIVGRTHLQDAVPTTMALVFKSYAATLAAAREFVDTTSNLLAECTLGSTAIGTGITSRPGYREKVIAHVNKYLGQEGVDFTLRPPLDYGKTTSSMFEISAYSKALAAYAIELGKIANDVRLYASGPRAGLSELILEPLQPGSSIMPGKVNPVMMEMVNQICTIVEGNDFIVARNAAAGQFQLNVMCPTVLWKLSESMMVLTRGLNKAVPYCIDGIALNVDAVTRNVDGSLVGGTILKNIVGYEHAAVIVKEACKRGATLAEVAADFSFMNSLGLGDFILSDHVMPNAFLALTVPPGEMVPGLDSVEPH